LYGAAKIFTEGLLASFRATSGLDYIVLRPCHVYGPRMAVDGPHTEFLVRWMERIAGGLNPIVFGDGTTSMDLIFVEDVARAFVLATAHAGSGEIFNIGSGVETSLTGIAHALIRAMDADVGVDAGPPAPTPVPRRLAGISKARTHLGFEPRVGLDEGLRRLVEWWRLERQRVGVAAG
jgi:UDP-glucose 4-epimerase